MITFTIITLFVLAAIFLLAALGNAKDEALGVALLSGLLGILCLVLGVVWAIKM